MKLLIITAFAVASIGCVSNQEDLSPTFGRATSANMAAQIIDPTPAAGAPKGDGVLVDQATLRYRTDKVKQPKQQKVEPGSSGS
jgi:hypothetical protein